MPPAELLRRLYDAAVQRALPLHTLGAHLPPPPRGRTVVIGAGKAGGAMAQAVEALWLAFCLLPLHPTVSRAIG